MDDVVLADVLRQLDPRARSALRRVLISDQRRRDAEAERLLRRRAPGATDLAELIDMFSFDDDARRQVVRLLGEIEAEG